MSMSSSDSQNFVFIVSRFSLKDISVFDEFAFSVELRYIYAMLL